MLYRRCLATALMLTGCASVRVQEALIEPATLGSCGCIAVLPFVDGGDGKVGLAVAEAVASALLTSDSMNVIGPSEAQQVLALLGQPKQARASLAATYAAVDALGVDAVLTGVVIDSGQAGPGSPATRTLGFVVELIASGTYNTLWSASVSADQGKVLVDLPHSRERLLREAAEKLADMLTEQSGRVAAGRGLCERAYAQLTGRQPALAARVETVPGGEPQLATAQPSSGTAGAGAGGASSAGTQVNARSTEVAGSSASPGLASGTSAAGGAGAPGASTAASPSTAAAGSTATAPGAPASSDAGGGLPALPSEPAPALPGLPSEPGLPGLPSDTGSGLPALPSDSDIGLPALPSEPAGGALPTLPSLDNSGLPTIPDLPATGGPSPSDAVGKLKGPARNFGKSLIANQPVELRGAFPDYKKKELALSPKAKKFVEAIGAVLKAVPTMLVRLDVTVGLTGKASEDEKAQAEAEQQAVLVRELLTKSFGVTAERVATRTHGEAGAKRGDKKKNVMVVTGLRY